MYEGACRVWDEVINEDGCHIKADRESKDNNCKGGNLVMA